MQKGKHVPEPTRAKNPGGKFFLRPIMPSTGTRQLRNPEMPSDPGRIPGEMPSKD
jgi:hypothetical protein